MYVDDTIGFSSATPGDGGLHAIAVRTDEPEPASGGLLDREQTGETPDSQLAQDNRRRADPRCGGQYRIEDIR